MRSELKRIWLVGKVYASSMLGRGICVFVRIIEALKIGSGRNDGVGVTVGSLEYEVALLEFEQRHAHVLEDLGCASLYCVDFTLHVLLVFGVDFAKVLFQSRRKSNGVCLCLFNVIRNNNLEEGSSFTFTMLSSNELLLVVPGIRKVQLLL